MSRLKYYTISEKFGWQLAGVTSFMLLILGSVSFGYGLKLMEYAEKKDLTPVFAGVPMLMAGIVGAGVLLSRKKCIVKSYAIMCVIVSLLSIHMNYRFMVKEFLSIALYKRQCEQSHTQEQEHCDQYAGTIVLCCVSVSMPPVTFAALLACFLTHRNLNKKNSYLVWFTLSKVVPARQTCGSSRERRNNRKNVGLTKFTQSTERISETPVSPQSVYLPRIPDFSELAKESSNLGYRDSLMLEYELDEYNIGKRYHSKSLENLEEHRNQGKINIKSARGSEDNITSTKRDTARGDQKNTEIDLHRFAHSDADLGLIEHNYYSHRKSCRDNEEYYDSAAEDWIQKMAENFKNSRSRLYGVSDDETLDCDEDSVSHSDKANDLGISITKHLLSQESNGNKETSKDKASSSNEPTLSTDIKQRKDSYPSTTLEKRPGNSDSVHGFSTKIPPSPPPRNLHEQTNSSYLEENENQELLQDRMEGEYSSGEENQVKVTVRGDTHSNMLDNLKTDLTPAGLTTPVALGYSSNGRLHFEFDKAPCDTTDYTRNNWIAFEKEENQKKSIQGKMSSSEYKDFTSYVM